VLVMDAVGRCPKNRATLNRCSAKYSKYQLLAARRTGALIILEGKDSLDSYVDLRTKFDAEEY
jgi:hypothetical protein